MRRASLSWRASCSTSARRRRSFFVFTVRDSKEIKSRKESARSGEAEKTRRMSGKNTKKAVKWLFRGGDKERVTLCSAFLRLFFSDHRRKRRQWWCLPAKRRVRDVVNEYRRIRTKDLRFKVKQLEKPRGSIMSAFSEHEKKQQKVEQAEGLSWLLLPSLLCFYCASTLGAVDVIISASISTCWGLSGCPGRSFAFFNISVRSTFQQRQNAEIS